MRAIELNAKLLDTGVDRGVEAWNTRGVEGNPFIYWQDLICREWVELQIATPQPNRFEASMIRRQLGCMSVNLITARA